jgi:hypothetical protein
MAGAVRSPFSDLHPHHRCSWARRSRLEDKFANLEALQIACCQIRRFCMPALQNPRHEAFAQALARGTSASAAYVEAGYKANRHNAATLARKQHILTRVSELQEEQLAIHQQATAQAASNAQVTLESLIAEAEAARAKAMEEKGGAAAAVSALIAKAKLAGMWREKIDQHTTGTGTVSTVWSVSWEDEGGSDGREAGQDQI